MTTIGVLALQGDFAKHISMIKSLGVKAIEVRTAADLLMCNGLIIPGGESTTMLKQIDFIELKESLCAFAKEKPVFGTCAGLILMASQIVNSTQYSFGLLDVSVERNAFGKQIDSFSTPIELHLDGSSVSYEALFIRAPIIQTCGRDVTVLASYEKKPVLVRQGMHLGATFHPELTGDYAIHQYFLAFVKV